MTVNHIICRAAIPEMPGEEHRLVDFMFHRSKSISNKPYKAGWKRMADTLEAVLGAVYIASGQEWRENCLQVMKRLNIDASAAWGSIWNDAEVSDNVKRQIGSKVWKTIESEIGKEVFLEMPDCETTDLERALHA